MELIAEVDHEDGTASWYVSLDQRCCTVVVKHSQCFCLADGHVEMDFDAYGRPIGIQLFGFGIPDGSKTKLAWA
jgi:hypothetical protein